MGKKYLFLLPVLGAAALLQPSVVMADLVYDPFAGQDMAEYVSAVEYTGLTWDRPETELSEEEYETALAGLLSSYDTVNEIRDRAVEKGDRVRVSYEAIGEDGVIEEFWEDGAELTVGENTTFEAFEDELVGAPCQTELSMELELPESVSAEHGGETVEIVAQVDCILEEQKQELTEDFIASLGNENFSTVEEFESYYRDYLLSVKQEYYENASRQALWKELLADAQFSEKGGEYIAAYTEEQETALRGAAEEYGVTMDEFAAMEGYEDEEALLEEVDESAADYARQILLIYYISDAEGLAYTEDEYYDAVDEYAEYLGYEDTASLITAVGLDAVEESVGNSLLCGIVLDFITENAVASVADDGQETID